MSDYRVYKEFGSLGVLLYQRIKQQRAFTVIKRLFEAKQT